MNTKNKLISTIACLGLITASQAMAIPNAGFSEIGFIQDANLRAPGAGVNPIMAGGVIRINGKAMIVPDNSIVQFPASSWTWAQLFTRAAWAPVYDPAITTPPINAPAPPAGTTGLALNDPVVNHFPSYQVTAVGNIITNPTTGAQAYVIGMILPSEQQGLNNHGGYINFIDYANGRFRVGGTLNDPNTGALVEINDPVGRYGLIHSPDQRFQADTNNPTITTANGYPVCIPRVAPPAVDALCPTTNRPANNPASADPNQPFDPFLAAGAPLKTFTMPPSAAAGTTTPDPYQQVPLMVGDWVDVAGTIFKINPTIASNVPSNQYISAHTLTAHLGVKTTPGTQPAYIRVETFGFGVGDANGGPTVAGITQETSTHISLVAFTTDADANQAAAICTPGSPNPLLPDVAIYGIHADPVTGAETEVLFPDGKTTSALNVANGDLCMDDAIRGRIRWLSPKHFKKPATITLENAAGPGNFYREYVVRMETAAGASRTVTAANGLIAGQYRLPIFDYLFGEGAVFGQPLPPFNFNDFGFLVNGQGLSGPNGVRIGPLRPFPTFQ